MAEISSENSRNMKRDKYIIIENIHGTTDNFSGPKIIISIFRDLNEILSFIKWIGLGWIHIRSGLLLKPKSNNP